MLAIKYAYLSMSCCCVEKSSKKERGIRNRIQMLRIELRVEPSWAADIVCIPLEEYVSQLYYDQPTDRFTHVTTDQQMTTTTRPKWQALIRW